MRQSLRSLLVVFGLVLSLIRITQGVKAPKSDALLLAEKDLEIARHMNDRSKKLIFDLDSQIDRLNKRVRTGRSLRTVLKSKPKRDPFKQLRLDILAGDLRKTRAAPL